MPLMLKTIRAMNANSKKSVMDFNGQAMPKSQQKTVKGGSDGQNSNASIIIDDLMDN